MPVWSLVMMEHGEHCKVAVADVSGTCFFSSGNPKHGVGVSLDHENSE